MHHLHQCLKALSYWSTNSKKEHRKMFAMLPLFFCLVPLCRQHPVDKVLQHPTINLGHRDFIVIQIAKLVNTI